MGIHVTPYPQRGHISNSFYSFKVGFNLAFGNIFGKAIILILQSF